MNEASSKYVDMIATDKLLQEKLALVHHAPDPSEPWIDVNLDDLARLPHLPENVHTLEGVNSTEISFPSALPTKYAENDRVLCHSSMAEQPRGDLIFVHGLYEDNQQIYNFFFSLLNEQGLNVHLLVLPYHYGRKPKASRFSGEYFWSANLQRSALAHKQAVFDLYQLHGYLCQRSGGPVAIAGFSMGGGIVLSLAALACLDRVFAINPVCNISTLVWSSALFAPIRRDLEGNGITFEDVKRRYRRLEPLTAEGAQTDLRRIILARSLYDQINSPGNYDLLVEKWKLTNVLAYKAGHLNILRVPRLAADIAHCLFRDGEPFA